MKQITVLADFHFNPSDVAMALDILKPLIETTLQEQGCLAYALHQDNQDQAHFVMIEQWASHQLWEQHSNAAHVATAGKAIQPYLASAITVKSFTQTI